MTWIVGLKETNLEPSGRERERERVRRGLERENSTKVCKSSSLDQNQHRAGTQLLAEPLCLKHRDRTAPSSKCSYKTLSHVKPLALAM
jgi:hypothetical protein